MSDPAKKKSTWQVFGFLVAVLLLFNWIGYAITGLSGGVRKGVQTVEVSPEGGEAIYWGKGRCYTCHSMGGQGSAVRGPNHGQFGQKFPLPMGARAVERAKERTAKTGVTYTATDYLAESLAEPGSYVVEGYKNEMAVVYAPPISLNLIDIKAVISYLTVQGGDLDMEAIDTNPSEVTAKFFAKIQAASAAGGGDPTAGEEVYSDNCGDCHPLGEDAGEGSVGPDLSNIGAKGTKYISDAILNPSKVITPGFETYEVVDSEGKKIIGLKTSEDAEKIVITKATGEEVEIAKADLKAITKNENQSIMPEDLNEAMTVKDFQDVLSFMIMQKTEPKKGEEK